MGSVGGRLVGSCWSQAEAGARLAEGWNDQSTVSEDFLLDYLHTYIPLLNNENPSPIVKISPKRMRSPPPPLPTSTSTTQSSNQPTSIKPPPKNHHKAKPDVSGLTWQDSEITGHEIHRSLGDDGEGINGVGFRPTPAIAQARRQKRKHQLSEWRAREAREARQRRFEKRQQGGGKGCSVDLNVGGDGDEGQRRVVRFEEIG